MHNLNCAYQGLYLLVFSGLITSQVIAEAPAQPEQSPKVKIIFEIDPEPRFEPLLQWLTAGGWCDYIEVTPKVSREDICRLRERGFDVILHFQAHPDVLARDNDYKNRALPPIEEIMRRQMDCAGGDAEKVNWMMLLENDSAGVAHPQEVLGENPKTHAQAKALLDRHLDEAFEVANQYPKVKKWGMVGYAPSSHAFAARGLDALLVERTNDDVEDPQTGIAFCRGAARQYGIEWGVDFSLWWGPIYGCVQDLPTSYHKRNLYLAYFSGAESMRIEGGPLFWNAEKKEIYQLGNALDQFARFAKRTEPGVPDVPVAVMLAPDHGWMTPPYWAARHTAWNYARIPYRMGQRGIDGFFSAAYPGSNLAMQPFPFGRYENENPPASPFALSCIVPEFAPEPEDVFYTEEPVPFGAYESRDAARKALHDKQLETSPYRPMGSSRWGDIFDVLTTEAPGEVLGRYKALVLLGQVKFEKDVLDKLEAYVWAGGTVLMAAGVAGPQHSELTGLEMTPELHPAAAWQWQNGTYQDQSMLYVPAEAGPGVRILARTPEGKPLAACRTLGSGKVYTCLVPWYEDATGALCGPALAMFDDIFGELSPAAVEGLPAEWVTTRGANQRSVLVANHYGYEWHGKVTLKNLPKSYRICRELLTGNKISFKRTGSGAVANLTVPAYEVRVLRWEEGR